MSPDWEGERLWGHVPIGRDKAKSRWFSKSKSVCAGGSGKVPRLCAIWTPQCGGVKGKVGFIKRKSKILISNNRIFREKNISFFEDRERSNENLWTFLRNSPSFLFFLSIFFGKEARSFSLLPFAVSSSAPPYARTDTPLRIAHSASSQFLPSPFTFTRNLLIPCVLRVKGCALFAFTGEGKRGESFTCKSLMHSFLQPCGEEVKAKNKKRRTRV